MATVTFGGNGHTPELVTFYRLGQHGSTAHRGLCQTLGLRPTVTLREVLLPPASTTTRVSPRASESGCPRLCALPAPHQLCTDTPAEDCPGTRLSTGFLVFLLSSVPVALLPCYRRTARVPLGALPQPASNPWSRAVTEQGYKGPS